MYNRQETGLSLWLTIPWNGAKILDWDLLVASSCQYHRKSFNTISALKNLSLSADAVRFQPLHCAAKARRLDFLNGAMQYVLNTRRTITGLLWKCKDRSVHERANKHELIVGLESKLEKANTCGIG